MTSAVPVLISDSQHPEHTTAAVHIGSLAMPHASYRSPLPFSIGETHPFASATWCPLGKYQSSAPEQRAFSPMANSLRAFHRGPTATCVAETEGHACMSFHSSARVTSRPCSSTGPDTPPQACATSLSADFVTSESAAQTGPARRGGPRTPSLGGTPSSTPYNVPAVQQRGRGARSYSTEKGHKHQRIKRPQRVAAAPA